MKIAVEGTKAAKVLVEDELKRMSRQVKELVPCHDVNEDDRINIRHLFDDLFATASSPSLSATHRVAAWNTLCAFIDELARSNIDDVRNLLWSHGICLSAFNLYISDSQHARPKSAKQLLVTLGHSLRKCNNLAGVQEYIGERAAKYLISDVSPRETKAFLQLLTQFLNKDLVQAGAVSEVLSRNVRDHVMDTQSLSIGALLTCLFRWASLEDFGSATGRCLSVVLDKHSQDLRHQSASDNQGQFSAEQSVWSSALDACIRDGSADIEQLRVHIFPVLFGRSLSQYTCFLRAHGLDQLFRKPADGDGMQDPEDNKLLNAALLSGKELGLIYDVNGAHISEDAAELRIPMRVYTPLLRNRDRNTRITGLSLLIASRSATRPFLCRALRLLKSTLPVFFADNDANFRSEVFSLVQRLMDRLRSVTAVLARKLGIAARRSPSDDTAANTLREHREFLKWLLRFLAWELRPTASYQRHISALKSLSIVIRSGIDPDVCSSYWTKSASVETKWPFSVPVLFPGLQQLLLDLLIDPFDDVRQTASSIFSMYAGSSSQVPQPDLDSSLEQGEKTMLATGRADQADGVAHMYALLARTRFHSPEAFPNAPIPSLNVVQRLLIDLERMLENAKTSLSAAAIRYPMHGRLTSIHFILRQQSSQLSNEDLDRLITSLHRVWETVKPVLCNDAPEGFEIEDAEESTESQGSTKDVLSYCWRALKESSLLLGTLVTDKHLDPGQALGLSDLCFSQLTELRHRGAFSTVAQMWVICCNRAAGLASASSLERWYERTFDILKNKTTINTRRSAGIPSLLCGLLIADPSGILLPRAFQDLSAIAKEHVDSALANESSLPQVHALNCIKDILRNTRLGEQSERYVPSALRLAADSLQSEAWAIRNCGLMLFRAVIDRLLGTSDAYLEDDAIVQKRISAQQHPGLLDTVLQLLHLPGSNENDASTRFEGVFPALQMLQRMDLPQNQMERAQDAALELTSSTSWHVRDKAARTYAALGSGSNSSVSLAELLRTRIGDQNSLHGTLLCIKYTIRNAIVLSSRSSRSPHRCPSPGESMLETTLDDVAASIALQQTYTHPVTKAAFSDILVEYMHLRHLLSRDDSGAMTGKKGPDRTLIPDFLDSLQNTTPKDLEGAIERASLARAYAFQLTLGWDDGVGSLGSSESATYTIVQLGHKDADACTEFWRALRTAYENGASSPRYLQTTILPAATKVLSDKLLIRSKCEVQTFLLHLADAAIAVDDVARVCAASSSPLAEGSNQVYADQWLQLYAIVLDDRIRRGTICVEDLNEFISSCKAAVAGDGFYSREAAALALGRMQLIWPLIAESKCPLACDTYLTIYDLLNDDDEDLRLHTTETVSRVLRSANPDAWNQNTNLEPITASQRLLPHMLTHLQHERTFAIEVFTRAFNTRDTVVDLLHAYSQQDTSLFAQEKQNLYIDEAREAKVWSQVLLRLPVQTIPKSLIRDLTFWIDEGLYTLTSHLHEDRHPPSQPNSSGSGALTWTSKPETFVLGLRVIYGVEFLFAYLGKGGRLPMEGSEILRRMAGLQDVLGRVEGCVLWRWEVERVVGGIVEGRVRLARRLMGEVSV